MIKKIIRIGTLAAAGDAGLALALTFMTGIVAGKTKPPKYSFVF